MKFQFRLERVLKHRKTEVDTAKRDFMAALEHVNKAKEVLSQMKADLQASVELREKTSQSGGAVTNQLGQTQIFIDGQKIRIQKQSKTVAGFESIAEAKREILTIAVQNEKILEKFRERKKEQFRAEQRKLEIKALDDLVTGRSWKKDEE